jgi:hypothetical protein
MRPRHEESPKAGGAWLGNAAVSERNRVSCLEHADEAEARGDAEAAERLRSFAATHRADRDRIQRLELRRQLNRSMALRRRYH